MSEPQPDLFGRIEAPRYPDVPGSRSAPASREAARAMTTRAGTLRRAVLDRYRGVYPSGLAADEVAKTLNESILSIRPRVTELLRGGLLERTTERHCNASGIRAHRLRASPLALRGEG